MVPAVATALLLATTVLPAAGLDVAALHTTTGWRLDNRAGFANVSIEGVSVPAAVLQLLQQATVHTPTSQSPHHCPSTQLTKLTSSQLKS